MANIEASKRVKVGDKIGRLKVVALSRTMRSSGRWRYDAECRCDCGAEVVIERGNFRRGRDVACPDCSGFREVGKRKHGHSYRSAPKGSLEAKCYYTWAAIKRRCNNPSDTRFSDYGGRGIGICEKWSQSYVVFLADMGLPPTKDHQVDRVNNDGDYCPENCVWVSRKANGRNKRNNRIIEADGKRLTLAEWSEVTGITRESIAARIKRGWSEDEALEIAPRRKWERMNHG